MARGDEFRRLLCHLTERQDLVKGFGNPLFLHCVSTLFVRNAVTPFCETEILAEFVRSLLVEWDREKNVIRAREPWASHQMLSGIFGELCFKLLLSNKEEFTTVEASDWMEEKFGALPSKSVLLFLLVQGLIAEGGKRDVWRVSHHYLQQYFAALRAVESAGSAMQFLSDWKNRRDMRDVLRLACGISSDATFLLQGVLKSRDVREVDRGVLLAEILAQPVAAEEDVVNRSCDTAVAWLDNAVKNWRVENVLNEPDTDTLWQLHAAKGPSSAFEEDARRALMAIHLARSGRAKGRLTERMSKGKSSFLRAFSGSMSVDGRLRLDVDAGEKSKRLRAAVVAPQLS